MKYKQDVDPLCSFCHQTEETVIHLFWECSYCQSFWCDLILLLNRKLDYQLKHTVDIIVFGLFDATIPLKKRFVFNLCFLLAKFHIHVCKFSNVKPNLIVFKCYLQSYLDTLKFCKNSKAVKTRNVFSEYALYKP